MHTQASAGEKKKKKKVAAYRFLCIANPKNKNPSVGDELAGGRAKTSCAVSGDVSRLQLQIFSFLFK